ncbi:hypothetical protein [Agathobacter sp.]
MVSNIYLKDILKKNNNDMVMVNLNWLNCLWPIAMRNIEEESTRNNVVKHFMKAFDRADNDRVSYVPMTVGEIKICAGSTESAPANTFRNIEETE